MKLAYHSLTSLDQSDEWMPYYESLRDHLDEVSRPDTEFELMGVSRGVGDTYYSFATLEIAEATRNLLELYYRDDIDGIAIGNTFDPGLRPAREILSIPVMGLFETAVLTAHTLAEQFAVVAVNDKVATMLRNKLREYELGDRVVGVYGPDYELDFLADAFRDPEPRAEFVDAYGDLVAESVDDGAELVVPGGGLAPELLRVEGVSELHGVPIMDKIAVLVKRTETMVDLFEYGAVSTSKKRMYRPPEDGQLDEFMSVYDI